MKAPTIYELRQLVEYVAYSETSIKTDGGYVPARPVGDPGFRSRLRAAWLVLTGRADAVIWPGGQ